MALGFRELFSLSMQIGFLKIASLTEEIHTIFSSKNFSFLHFLWWQEFPDVEKGTLGFCKFFVFRCKSSF
jgi:hypothetical protein